MPEVQMRSPQQRKVRAKTKTPPQAERLKCGLPKLTGPYLFIWFDNGTVVRPSIKAMREAGTCPECYVEAMIERGLIAPYVHDEYQCNHTFRGVDTDELGTLLSNLDNITLHNRTKINLHLMGGSV